MEMIRCSDYYPGGSIMPGRSFSSNSYRYGFNAGSEKDDEISGSGNHYTTYFREFDTRLNRTWSIDPKGTAWESPYASMGNNPILYNDPLGDSVKFGGLKERVQVGLARLGSKEFNNEFKKLKASDDVFTYNNTGATSGQTGGVDLTGVNQNAEGFISNAEFSINYSTKDLDKSAPVGKGSLHGLFEETLHSTDYLKTTQGTPGGSGIGIQSNPNGGLSLGWNNNSGLVTGEALAWKFAADNNFTGKSSGYFMRQGFKAYTGQTIIGKIRAVDVKEIGKIGQILFTEQIIKYNIPNYGEGEGKLPITIYK